MSDDEPVGRSIAGAWLSAEHSLVAILTAEWRVANSSGESSCLAALPGVYYINYLWAHQRGQFDARFWAGWE